MTTLTDLTTVRTALFVKIDVAEYRQASTGPFFPQTLRFSDHDSEFELFPGETYTALGQLMNVTSTTRELTPTSSTVNVQISGIPPIINILAFYPITAGVIFMLVDIIRGNG